ncbi:MAG TPA: HEAT repeat domain-containing protein, partial [Armatimonadota bacterium]
MRNCRRLVLALALVMLAAFAVAQGNSGDVDALLQQVKSEVVQTRLQALDRLAKLSDPRIIPALGDVLSDKDPTVRAKAASTVGKIGGPKAVAALLPLLKDEIATVRTQAVRSLAETKDLGAVSPIVALARDPASDLRPTAIAAVGPLLRDLIDNEEAVKQLLPTLLALCTDQDQKIRTQGEQMSYALANGRTTGKALVNVAAGILGDQAQSSEVRRHTIMVLGRNAGVQAVPLLTTAFKGPEQWVSNAAGAALASILRNGVWAADPALLAPIRDLLNDPNTDRRISAIRIAGATRDMDAIDPLLAMLREQNESVRFEAANALVIIADERVLPALCALRTDTSPRIREIAVRVLNAIGDAPSMEALAGMTADQDIAVRRRLVQYLGALHTARANEALLTMLPEKNADVWKAVVDALNGSHDPRLVDSLFATVNDGPPAVRGYALAALGWTGDARVAPLALPYLDTPESPMYLPAIKALVALGDARGFTALDTAYQQQKLDDTAYLACLKGLASPDALERLVSLYGRLLRGTGNPYFKAQPIIQTLMTLGTPAMERIIALLDDPRPDVRQAAIRICCEMPDARAVPGLLRCLREETDPQVTGLLIYALAHIQDARAIDPLAEKLRDANATVRLSAVRMLGEFPDRRLTPYFLPLQTNANPEVRLTAILWLSKYAAQQRVTPLLPLLADGSWMVRSAAIDALSNCGSDEATDALLKCLRDTQPNVRFAARTTLGNIGTLRAVQGLLDYLATAPRSGEYYSDVIVAAVTDPNVLDLLLPAAHHQHPLVRATAIRALGNYTDAQAQRTAVAGLTDPDERVRIAAAHALGTGKTPPTIARPPLQTALSDPAPAVRKAAVEALGTLGDPLAAPALLRVASEEQEYNTRIAANHALIALGDQQSLAALLPLLDTDPFIVNMDYIPAIVSIKDARTVPGLVSMVSSTYFSPSYRAVTALGAIGDRRAVTPLLLYFDAHRTNPNGQMAREEIVKTLGMLGDLRACHMLLLAVQGDDTRVRAYAAEALGRLKAAPAVPALIAALNDLSYPTKGARGYSDGAMHANVDDTTREKAAWALGEIGDARAV